ncbi:MAG: hypothetical protein ACOYMB_05050 [Patescibacteria group bacterium]
MKIVICGSMKFSKEMVDLQVSLNQLGFDKVVVPHNVEKYIASSMTTGESTKNKINQDLIRAYFQEIDSSDAVLIANYDKNGVKNYVGGNSFLEAAFAHVLNKKLYFLNDIPEMSYSDEMKAFQPIILNGDLSQIK